MKERDHSLDLMRLLGVLVIMIAHAEPPEWLFQLRNFGTPLLIVASGLTYALVYKEKKLSVLPFLRKRLTKLTLPAWLFLTIFFGLFYIIITITGSDYPFTRQDIMLSYTFNPGIDYIWILKIYIILALLTPAAFFYKRKVNSKINYFVIIFIIYFLYELTMYYFPELSKANFLSIIPFTLLFLYGMKLGDLSNKSLIIISVTSLFIFAGIATYMIRETGHFVFTQTFKYPPTLYYLSYAFFAIHVTLLTCKSIVNHLNHRLIVWLSSNSLWIYLWHIFACYLWEQYIGTTNGDLFISFIKAVYLLGFGISLTLLQVYLVKKYLSQSNRYVYKKIAGIL